MNLAKRIQAWLAQPSDYQEGVELLREAGGSAFLVGLLSRSDDRWNRKKLSNELGLRLTHLTARPAEPVPIQGEKPDSVLKLEGRAGRLMDERVEMKARIRAKADDDAASEDRRTWAFRILAIGRELDDVYGLLRFWKEHGYLPIEKDAEVEIDERAALLNVRTYVSRYRKKLAGIKPDDPKYSEMEKLLEGYEAEKKRLEVALGIV